MTSKGGSNTGHMPREYYIDLINDLCGTRKPRVVFLKRMSAPELRELVMLLEMAQETGVYNFERDRRSMR